MPDRNVIPVGGLGLDEAAMVEFLAVGAHGVQRSGAAAAIFAKARGAEVTIVDMSGRRLAFCQEEIGIEHVFELSPDIDEHLKAVTDSDFFDIVLDATGGCHIN